MKRQGQHEKTYTKKIPKKILRSSLTLWESSGVIPTNHACRCRYYILQLRSNGNVRLFCRMLQNFKRLRWGRRLAQQFVVVVNNGTSGKVDPLYRATSAHPSSIKYNSAVAEVIRGYFPSEPM